MSKQTFTDPKTGEEIESTWTTRFFVGALELLPMIFLFFWFPLLFGAKIDKVTDYLIIIMMTVVLSIVNGLLSEAYGRSEKYPWLHDCIARLQHRYRQSALQRKLLEEEWAGVPDDALSRARPPSEPEPSAMSLSVAEPPEELQPRLTESVGESKTTEEAVVEVCI